MKSLMTAAAVAAFAVVSAPAFAQTLPPATFAPVTYSGSLGYSQVDARSVDLGAIQARLDARFGPYVGVEGEAAIGVVDQTEAANGVNAKIHLDDEFAAYAVGYLPLTAKGDLFARVGYGQSRLKASVSSPNGSVSGFGNLDSWNYGVGGQYLFDGKNGVRVDWTREHMSNFDVPAGLNVSNNANVWAVSFVHKF